MWVSLFGQAGIFYFIIIIIIIFFGRNKLVFWCSYGHVAWKSGLLHAYKYCDAKFLYSSWSYILIVNDVEF